MKLKLGIPKGSLENATVELFRRAGFLDDLGEGRFFRGVDSGVTEFLKRNQLYAQTRSA